MPARAIEILSEADAADPAVECEHDRLLLLATDRFCRESDHDRLTLGQYREAFRALAAHVNDGTLRKAAAKLALNPFAERETILYLAMENAKVAAPVLRASQKLTQLDMIQIIERAGVEHAREIATRPDIGPSVIKRLKRLRDPLVNRACEENPALVTNKSARAAETLFNQIKNLAEARERELSRMEEARMAADRAVLSPPPIMSETDGLSGEARLLKAVERQNSSKPRSQPAAPQHPTDLLSDSEFGRGLEKAAVARSRQSMALLLVKKFGVSNEAAQAVFDDKTGDALCVAMSAANVSAERANRILLLTFPTIGLSVQNAMRSVRFFDKLNARSSRAAVDQWPREEPALRKATKTVHQPYLEDDATLRSPHRPLNVSRDETRKSAMPKVQTLSVG